MWAVVDLVFNLEYHENDICSAFKRIDKIFGSQKNCGLNPSVKLKRIGG